MATSTASTVGTTTTRRRLLELSLEELEQLCVSLGQPAFRARQLFTWIYSELVFDFDQMANLPKAFRDELSRTATILPFEVAALQHTRDELTHKVLFRLADGKTVETVLMLYDPTEESRGRRTVCVSSQVGCAIGCPFCATGQSGFGRNLTAGEIVAQVLFFARLVLDHWESAPYDERPITNIVFMGQGEPLLNLKEMAQAIERLNSPYGFNLGARQMTVSTSGIIPKIHEFARLPYQLNLAISLHAPNDELRDELVPINQKYPIADLMAACRTYVATTGRRVTFEYVLIDGVNDSHELAIQLANLVGGMLCHVNLIPLNPTSEYGYPGSPFGRVLAFQRELVKRGVNTTVRVERGQDIDAACGQLRTSVERKLRQRSSQEATQNTMRMNEELAPMEDRDELTTGNGAEENASAEAETTTGAARGRRTGTASRRTKSAASPDEAGETSANGDVTGETVAAPARRTRTRKPAASASESADAGVGEESSQATAAATPARSRRRTTASAVTPDESAATEAGPVVDGRMASEPARDAGAGAAASTRSPRSRARGAAAATTGEAAASEAVTEDTGSAPLESAGSDEPTPLPARPTRRQGREGWSGEEASPTEAPAASAEAGGEPVADTDGRRDRGRSRGFDRPRRDGRDDRGDRDARRPDGDRGDRGTVVSFPREGGEGAETEAGDESRRRPRGDRPQRPAAARQDVDDLAEVDDEMEQESGDRPSRWRDRPERRGFGNRRGGQFERGGGQFERGGNRQGGDRGFGRDDFGPPRGPRRGGGRPFEGGDRRPDWRQGRPGGDRPFNDRPGYGSDRPFRRGGQGDRGSWYGGDRGPRGGGGWSDRPRGWSDRPRDEGAWRNDSGRPSRNDRPFRSPGDRPFRSGNDWQPRFGGGGGGDRGGRPWQRDDNWSGGRRNPRDNDRPGGGGRFEGGRGPRGFDRDDRRFGRGGEQGRGGWQPRERPSFGDRHEGDRRPPRPRRGRDSGQGSGEGESGGERPKAEE